MAPGTNRQIRLIEKPQNKLGVEHFQLTEGDIPAPKDGEVLARIRYISIDPANRAWMQGKTYRREVLSGQVMDGYGLGEVVESRSPNLKPGDLFMADVGWQDYVTLPGEKLTKLPQLEPLSHHLSIYGLIGLTAHIGLMQVGRPKAGETVVVSGAAGAVGSLVGQIAKLKGCHVIGIAGGAEKCEWLKSELGFDAAIDYKASPIFKTLRAAAPNGIDVYFDNVGGDILEACLFQMNMHGRIACCGAISSYDGPPPAHGPRGVPGVLIVQRLTMQGFILFDYQEFYDSALADLHAWVKAGELKVIEDVIEGLDQAPNALVGLLAGANFGKRMVKVS